MKWAFVALLTACGDSQKPTDAQVQPLGAPTELDTPLGHATVWHAGEASARYPTP